MYNFFRLEKKQKRKQAAISLISIWMLMIMVLQPAFASIGPGTDLLYTDDETMIKCGYVSDSSTSKIEKLFTGRSEDDGRIETDKSVTYGKDEYSAFEKYEPGEFCVTLSALGQKYENNKKSSVKAPLDVVLVLDISGSMSVKGDGKRIDNLVSAVNNTITYLMKEDKNNRVAVVAYNNCAIKILPLDRYYVGDVADYSKTNTYFSVDESTQHEGYKILKVGEIKKEDTEKNTTNASKIYEVYGATYTQDGIKVGADILIDEKNITYNNLNSEGNQTKGNNVSGNGANENNSTSDNANQSIVRTPNIVLLSDGVPTLGNYDYKKLAGDKKFGDGTSVGSVDITTDTKGYSNNDKGIFGYYTILTAQYYKDLVGKHYNGNSDSDNNRFYTIGVGVSEGEGYDYISQVLHPTADNLKRCKDSSDPRATELYKALSKIYDNEKSITVGNANTGVQASSSTKYYTNPYTNYAYADGTVMGKDAAMDSDTLGAIFKQFLDESGEMNQYVSCTEPGLNAVEMVDYLGENMEVKGAPVLSYNGKTYEVSNISTKAGVTTCYFQGVVDSATYGNKAVDLSKVVVTITKDKDGNQIIRWGISSELLPEIVRKKAAIPIRLFYKVGPTKALLEEMEKESSAKYAAENGNLSNQAVENGNSSKKVEVNGNSSNQTIAGTPEEQKILYTNMWNENKVTNAASVPGTNKSTNTTSVPGTNKSTNTTSVPGTNKETNTTFVPGQDRVAYASFAPSKNNPYYYGKSIRYEVKETYKDENATVTEEFSSAYKNINDGRVSVQLGNNGKLTLCIANNSKIYDLPDTGGIGPEIFQYMGVIILLAVIMVGGKLLNNEYQAD